MINNYNFVAYKVQYTIDNIVFYLCITVDNTCKELYRIELEDGTVLTTMIDDVNDVFMLIDMYLELLHSKSYYLVLGIAPYSHKDIANIYNDPALAINMYSNLIQGGYLVRIIDIGRYKYT